MFTRLTCLLLLAVVAAAAQGESLKVWVAGQHEKVFRDTVPPENATTTLRLEAARNEFEPAQFAARSDKPLAGLTIETTPLRQAVGGAVIPAENLAWNFVGFIPLRKNTRDAAKLWVRRAPCEVPDPLLDDRKLDLPANTTQPVWLTVRVPRDAKPGLYRGQVRVLAGKESAALPVELTVWPFTLPDERHLFITNWFNVSRIARAHGVELWSDTFWRLLARYADAMATHRQNVALVPWRLIQVTRRRDGSLALDYSRFDRYVEVFERAAVADRLEIGHIARFGPGGWGSKTIVLTSVPATDEATGKRINLSPEDGLAPLLSDLEKHLAAKGWLGKAMIHVADEPSIRNVASWRKASEFVHRAARRLRRIDAIETLDFAGALEVWVPKLSHYERWRSAYEARRADNEFWFYICCHPYGNHYPNRFLDYPLACVRVLHWINFAYDLAGYLHWGLNFWPEDPFGPPPDRLPPGDTHVIYPGKDGPLSSLRWEIQRESIEDYEYLHLLMTKTAALKKRLGKGAAFIDERRRALELCRRVIPSITTWERDPAKLAAVRAAIADEIVALDAEPLLLVQTEPAAGATLVNGPIAVEVRGVVQPGTTVKVSGRTVEVRPDGSFACLGSVRGDPGEIAIEAERDGKKRTTTRRFNVLR